MSTPLTIALAGNPNSGKTTMFNAITGARQHVGNYPGVTVAKKEGVTSHNNREMRVVDLPGTYSLTPYTEEEIATRNFLLQERPSAVVDILDGNTLERSLYLAIQFLETGVPLVLALNMMDEVRRRKINIKSGKLSSLLGIPVVETVAREGEGKDALLAEAVRYADERKGSVEPLVISYGADIDNALDKMIPLIEEAAFLTDQAPARWTALKYIEGDPLVSEMGRKAGSIHNDLEKIAADVAVHLQRTTGSAPDSVIADHRYGFIASLMREGVMRKDVTEDRIRTTDRIDRVVTSTFFGPLIMLGILYGMFQMTFAVGEIPMGWVEAFFGWLSATAESVLPAGLLQSLVVSGIIDGVGGVMGFVPLILVMFFCLSFLEDLGYMARMAYMLDRVFKVFGLHGSSVMPFIVSGGIPGGCAVPGVMAARTLRSPREKLATILTAPFMACGAKVPVFILLIAAFFPGSGGNALFLITIGAWALALLTAKALRMTAIKGPATPFLMELPPYRIPTLRGVLIHTWERGWQYIKKAGTVILAISILLWAAMTFPGLPESDVAAIEAQRTTAEATLTGDQLDQRLVDIDNHEAELALKHSIAGRVGTSLEGVTSIAGFDWRTNIALIGGFAAKEVIVSTLGTAYSMGEVDAEDAGGLSAALVADPAFNMWTAISLIIFTLLYAPCFVTVVAMAKEAGWKWATFAMVFNTVLAFGLAAATYQIGTSL